MASENARAGLLSFKRNGQVLDAGGNFDYCLGTRKREAIVGATRTVGFSSKPQVPSIEGEIVDRKSLDLRELFEIEDETFTLELANGKTVILTNAWYAGDAMAATETGLVKVRLEGLDCREVK